MITGMDTLQSGTIQVGNVDVSGKTVREIRDLGVANISEDRMTYGAVADASVEENLISDRYQRPEYNKGLLFNQNIWKNHVMI